MPIAEKDKLNFNFSIIFFLLAIIPNGVGLLIDISNYEDDFINKLCFFSTIVSFSLAVILGFFIIFVFNNYVLYPKVITLLTAYFTFPMILISNKDCTFIYFLNIIPSAFGLVSHFDKKFRIYGFFPVILYCALFWLKIKYQVNIRYIDFYNANFFKILVSVLTTYLFTYSIIFISFKKLYEASIELKKYAYRDQLTGVYNRHYLYSQSLSNCGLVMIDIDNFKKLNDEFGHDNGDASLKALCRITQETLRKEDTVIRYGGEEFIIILKNLSSKRDLYNIAEAIRVNISNKSKVDASIKKSFSVSAGAILYNSEISLDQNIKLADSLLYCSKYSGKNKTSV